MSVTLRHAIDLSGWSEPLRRAAEKAHDLTAPHRAIGELLLVRVQENFRTEGGPTPWPELSTATLIERARGRTGTKKVFKGKASAGGTRTLTAGAQRTIEASKPLIFTGRLLRSIAYRATAAFVDVGSNLVYAARQFFGSAPGVHPVTPARNPFGLTDGDRGSILKIYADHLLGDLAGGGR